MSVVSFALAVIFIMFKEKYPQNNVGMFAKIRAQLRPVVTGRIRWQCPQIFCATVNFVVSEKRVLNI